MDGDEYEDQLLGDPTNLDDIIEARDFNPLEEDENVEGGAEDQGEDNAEEQKAKPKRVRVLNPQPKLDAIRLSGPRGIAIIENLFRDFKFYGHGYETQDLKRIMERLELWGNRLFPKYQFDDLLEKIEKLGHKRPVLNFINKIRMGIVTEDSVAENTGDGNVIDMDDAELNDGPLRETFPNDDPFSQLLEEQISQIDSHQAQNNILTSNTQPTITDEQRERMMRNRLLAEERRLARIKAQQEKNSMNIQSDVIPEIEASPANGESVEKVTETNPVPDNSANGNGEDSPKDVEIENFGQVTGSYEIDANVDETNGRVTEPSLMINNLDSGHGEDDPGDEEVKKFEQVAESHRIDGNVDEAMDVTEPDEVSHDLDNCHETKISEVIEIEKTEETMVNSEICDKEENTVAENSEQNGEKLTQVAKVGEEMKSI